jgi:hypothetical protein
VGGGTQRNDEDGDRTARRPDVLDPRSQHFARLRASTRDGSGTSEDGDAYGADAEHRFDNGGGIMEEGRRKGCGWRGGRGGRERGEGEKRGRVGKGEENEGRRRTYVLHDTSGQLTTDLADNAVGQDQTSAPSSGRQNTPKMLLQSASPAR